jgi:hypothetical protein
MAKEDHNILDAASDDLPVDSNVSNDVPSSYVTDRASKALSRDTSRVP